MKFTLKSELKSKMMRIILGTLMVSIVGFGFCVKTLDRKNQNYLANKSDAFFLISVTETTVGFGDTIPTSSSAKIFCVTSCLVGVTLIAILILAVRNLIELSNAEMHAYNAVKYTIDAKVLHDKAASFIQAWWILVQKRKKGEKRFANLLKYYVRSKKFRILRVQVVSKQEISLSKKISVFERYSHVTIHSAKKVMNGVNEFSEKAGLMLKKDMMIQEKSKFFKRNTKKILDLLGCHSVANSKDNSVYSFY